MTTPTASLNNAPATAEERAAPITLQGPKGHNLHLSPAEALELAGQLTWLANAATGRLTPRTSYDGAALVDALQVLVLTPATLEWLTANDPKALEQARAALAKAGA